MRKRTMVFLLAEPSVSILGGPDISFSKTVVSIGKYTGEKVWNRCREVSAYES